MKKEERKMRKIVNLFFPFFLFSLFFFLSCKTKPPVPPEIELVEPEFEIVSIVILQADLVNTQFETTLKVKNPNKNDINLSAIKYELHGNGRFWADGTANIDILIPAESSQDTKFRFSMNFINMSRDLLDDIIDLRRVKYTFKGEAAVTLDANPPFVFPFDISGLSDVKPRADSR